VHRDSLASALKIMQGDIPGIRARFYGLQSRLKDIDAGTSKECVVEEFTTREPTPTPLQLSWCTKVDALTDAFLDGRRSQKRWMKKMGAGLQRLVAMTIQLNQFIQDPVLLQDKIPLNALKALKKSWMSLQMPVEHLRLMGRNRASQAKKTDVLVLQLSALLQNASVEEKCAANRFRMRYGSKTCAILRSEVSAAAEARHTDLQELQKQAHSMLRYASKGLIDNDCTSPPKSQGCWVRMPTGCPKVPAWTSADKWTRDVFGEEAAGAAEDGVVCSTSRGIQMNAFCGVTNAEMKFIS
jgi:hypothetical protein